MKRRGGGAIVMIASIYGRESGGRMTYNAVKAAEISLAKSLAQQLAPDNIRVNSVAPGTVLFPDEERGPQTEKIIGATPLKKPGRPEDIAEMVLFLATSAEYITGQVFAVDGGKSIP